MVVVSPPLTPFTTFREREGGNTLLRRVNPGILDYVRILSVVEAQRGGCYATETNMLNIGLWIKFLNLGDHIPSTSGGGISGRNLIGSEQRNKTYVLVNPTFSLYKEGASPAFFLLIKKDNLIPYNGVSDSLQDGFASWFFVESHGSLSVKWWLFPPSFSLSPLKGREKEGEIPSFGG